MNGDVNWEPDGHTRLFLTVGNPIGQVRSPRRLTQILRQRSANAVVLPCHVEADDLLALIDGIGRMRNLDGILVTVPHKFQALQVCTHLSARAGFLGAVNVMRRSDEGWVADNLDGVGFFDGLTAEGFDIAGKRSLVIGAGGVGSAIAYEVLARGATDISIYDHDAARIERLIARLSQQYPGKAFQGGTDPRGFDIIINATPVGMRPDDNLPFQVDLLTPTQFVADVITSPAVSRLAQIAKRLGCRTMMGDEMFNAQAEALIDFLLE